MKSEIEDLNSIINPEKSTVWVDYMTMSQPAGSYVYWEFSASYAGYIVITVHASTTDNTYVSVIWSSYGVNYDASITVGSEQSSSFPSFTSFKHRSEGRKHKLV
ncbi:MAG: hypothetical protein ACUVTD_02980 [Nitrososphaerales archaeon]